MTIRKCAGAAGVALALLLSACGTDNAVLKDRSEDPLSAILGELDDQSRFVAGMEATGLDGVLEGEASYTLLAPSDAAFEALGPDAVAVLDDPDQGAIMAAILREHMLPGAFDLEAIRGAVEGGGGKVYMVSFGNSELSVSLDGEDIVVSSEGGKSARLGVPEIVGNNGVIIPIDAVLVDATALTGQSAQ